MNFRETEQGLTSNIDSQMGYEVIQRSIGYIVKEILLKKIYSECFTQYFSWCLLNNNLGNSLAVQWLGIYAHWQGPGVPNPGQGTRFHKLPSAAKNKKKISKP